MDHRRAEWFAYPAAWAKAYRRVRGSLRYFPQYALMELLRQQYGIEACTWLHLSSIDRQARRRVAAGEPWEPASPSQSSDPARTIRRRADWDTMRRAMGPAFEALQEAIVRAGFVGAYQGEPDLFCRGPRGWFFAEAKRPGEGVLPSQEKWWQVAWDCLGDECRIFTCRLSPEDEFGPEHAEHSAEWTRIAGEIQAAVSELGSGEAFVNRVLRRRSARNDG